MTMAPSVEVMTSEHMLAPSWAVLGRSAALTSHEGRPCLLSRAGVDRVRIESSGEWLPLLAEWVDERRFTWRKFELPATGTHAARGPAVEQVTLKLFRGGELPLTLRVRLENGLPRPLSPEDERPDSDVSRSSPFQSRLVQAWVQAAQTASRMYDEHIDFIESLCEGPDPSRQRFWLDSDGGIAAWPLSAVATAWLGMRRRTEPRPALIVSLADSIGRVLKEVCRNPRRFLKRERQIHSAGRIREIDATCLRWLARQPGVTVAQKAGTKQQAMGIVRVETCDSLENRVVRDLIIRAMKACERFLLDHDPQHEHVPLVRSFEHLLKRIWRDTPIAQVGDLTAIPSPNHVLQRDPCYAKLWRAYILLLKQQWQQEQAWRWRHRVWLEVCQLAVLTALTERYPHATGARSSAMLRPDQHCGRFIDERTTIGRWDVKTTDGGECSLWFADGRHLPAVAEAMPAGTLSESIIRMAPDAVILRRNMQQPDAPPSHILAMWTIFDFDLDGDRLRDRARQIEVAMRSVAIQGQMQGLLIQPRHGGETVEETGEVGPRRCVGWRLPMPPQSHVDRFGQIVRDALRL